jgi:FKBP-type peptidyl-prolyl cis-trans isomerase FkpA
MYARRIDYLRLSKDETDVLLQGVKDWAKDQKSVVNFDQSRLLVQNFIEERISEGSKVEKEKGKKYIEDFVKKGAKLTPSGLAYQIIKPGSSVKPGPTDNVEVHYEGTLLDGTVFDSSVERKEKASFPLDVVIKGWQEGLQLIGEGGEIKLAVPSDLAYGDRGSLPKIPGGATLLFNVTLFKITKSKK